jgi:hypothetical protein
MPIGSVLIVVKSTYEEWKESYNKSMTLEWHILVQTHRENPALDAIDDFINKCNQ